MSGELRPVMVCGAAGFLGSHLVERLLNDGLPVDAVDDLSTGSLGNLAVARTVGGALKFHTLDVAGADFAGLVARRAPETMYHLALLPPGDRSGSRTLSSISVLYSVLEAARHGGVAKVVACIPAGALYGDLEPRLLPAKEGATSEPRELRHVVARALVELLGVYRREHALEFTVLATSNVYGPRQRVGHGVVATFAGAVAAHEDAEIHGTGKQTRDFVFVDDAVDALVRARSKGGGLVINVGTGVQTTVEELWKLVAAGSGQRARRTEQRDGDLRRVAVSPVRARIQLGWAPWTSLREGLRAVRGRTSLPDGTVPDPAVESDGT